MAAPVEKKPEKKFDKKPVAPPPRPSENVILEIVIVLLVVLFLASFVGSLSVNGGDLFGPIGNFFAKILAFFKTLSASSHSPRSSLVRVFYFPRGLFLKS